MKFTLSWLKEFLDTQAPLDDILQALNDIGLEVEAVDNKAATLADFSVAYVREAVAHPNADKLKLLTVEAASGVLQIVCGAPNARAGMRGILALPGAIIPSTGDKLEKGVIRGVESQGMLCSERELLLSDAHNGIIEVDELWAVGTPAATALALDDPMIYIKVTANRPDALGVYGIARDLAARGLGQLKPHPVPAFTSSFSSPILVARGDMGQPSACPHYTGYYLRGVRNGPSPQWLQKLLLAIGLRPISTIVDITNYIAFSYGRPLHAFDADKIKGHLTVRYAHEGESFTALNDKNYDLSTDMVVIADDEGADCLGGIIGGKRTSCDFETRNIFLESAWFSPQTIAATGRKLAIHSDARYRLERGVDPAFTVDGLKLGAELIFKLCGGDISSLVEAGQPIPTQRQFLLTKSRVETLAGISIPAPQQQKILTDLGFQVSDAADHFSCQVPSWRPDIHGEADLVEEVCRIYGLNQIPFAPMDRPFAIARPVLTALQRRHFLIRRFLAARGFNEAVTWSFLPEAQAKLFGGGAPALRLTNPISVELSDMRPSLLPNLLTAAARNQKRGVHDLQIFEVGQVYIGDQPEDEKFNGAALRLGQALGRNWHSKARMVDVFDAKADALACLEAAGLTTAQLQVVSGAPSWFHPGRSGTLQLGPQNKLGYFGEIHPRILQALDVKGPVVAFELTFSALPPPKNKSSLKTALQNFDLMPVIRDFAFLVSTDQEAEKLVKAAKAADKNLITAVRVFDVFPHESGKTSLALEVTLQPKISSLTDSEIDHVAQKIIASVQKATGASLRS